MNAITTTSAEPAMLGFLQRAVSDPNFDTNKFEVVLGAMREEQAKHAERAFFAAMAEAQGEMEPIRKDSVNPHTKSRYASFEAIDSVLRPVYTRHGFCVSYRTGTSQQPGTVRMICTVAHAGGHSIEAELTASVDSSGSGGRTNKTDVQAVGSTVSYLRRYLVNMIWNVALAGEDDDGEGSRRQPPVRQQDRPQQRRPMDDVLKGDDIPDWDAPKPDRFRQAADRIKQRLSEAKTAEDYNHWMAGEDTRAIAFRAERDKIKAERPELADEIEAHRQEQLDRIAEAAADELPT